MTGRKDEEEKKDLDEAEGYLWDRSEPIDPAVARLEKALLPLRHEAPLRDPLPALPKAPGSRRMVVLVGGGASLAIAAIVAWLVLRHPDATQTPIPMPVPTPSPSVASCAAPSRGSHAFRTEGGAARCGAEERATGWVPLDGVLETPAGSTATLEIASLGTVAMDPGSKLKLLAAEDEKQTLDLVRGTLHAKISAPPRLFVVKTAAADAVDLGCEYTLSADEAGKGTLSVSFGSVSLERTGRAPTLVVEHSTCRIGPNGPGTPLAISASDALRRAADELDAGDATAIDRVLAACGENDTITLWHEMRRIDPEERGRAWDRLSRFVPPPASAPRAAVVRGERTAIAGYKEALLPKWFKR